MKKFYIKESYVERDEINYFNDTGNTDQWQLEVYQYAKEILLKNSFNKVLDIGTGSGYKLISNFDEYYTLGIDVPETVKWLKEKYPNKEWSSEFFPRKDFDLIICSDVIEHLEDPDQLISLIRDSNPSLIVLSTPDRNLIYGHDHDGPPKNNCHVREWTFDEFHKYISSHFNVLDHFISNTAQATQVILASLK
jgi:2-polyprenyl-3-methyl-5-hydroxy-6-metoxy-1,4-benzoquinol methylase